MTKQIKTVRGATGQVQYFDTREEALRHCLRRGDFNELWRIVE